MYRLFRRIFKNDIEREIRLSIEMANSRWETAILSNPQIHTQISLQKSLIKGWETACILPVKEAWRKPVGISDIIKKVKPRGERKCEKGY